ncbi:MAG: glutamine-hydrolyzing carbamoyl-phosphate synthase small subunit [Candidatus Levybacteria bacterium]|nr:glutamine-hydrolyzing carbamoyl-phosphate synthase small subunit [Candidatus Levybacteria bacterium]MBP9814785.1 glutamine-hydrolyzing carbamoyl-phosphate synthase small subunit [Candidatus Levybacteria bacterium]
MIGKLILSDGTTFSGKSFGRDKGVSGEVVFATGMVGYPESITDPSYSGQILVLTYPLIGNYGVSDKKFFESSKIHISGLVVCNYINTPSHNTSVRSLSDWLKDEGIPALEISDTRYITQKLRMNGTMLGKIVFTKDVELYDPNVDNLVALCSTKNVYTQGKGKEKIVLFDCGSKRNISRSLLKRGVQVITVPWDYDIFKKEIKPDGIVISNGPGDPKMADKTISIIKTALNKKIPTFGICLGNQILALAAGGDTYKLKYGHRSQNQPCLLEGTKRCYITTQNHGFAVGKIPHEFKPWFINANDGTNEGIIHKSLPFMSVQFHPESYPGPQDTEWLFDLFLDKVKRYKYV